MSPKPPIKAEQQAVVGVIQSGSENDHNSEAGRDSFLKLEDWIRPEFFDENTVADFFQGIKERRFSAVCFGSNALFNSVIHTAACAGADDVIEASQNGMGIVILQQFLRSGTRSCDFLPQFHQLHYQAAGDRRIDRIVVKPNVLGNPVPLVLDGNAFSNRAPVLWSTIVPLHQGAWCTRATVEADGQEHVVLMHTRASRGRIIASAIPLDWMSDRRLLSYAIGLSVRSLGTLFVRSDREHRRSIALGVLLGRSVAGGGHLSSVTVADPGEVSSKDRPFCDFSHLVVSEEWGWPELTSLSYKEIRGRYENGGSVAAFGSDATGGERVLSIVGGRPAYLKLAHQFAAWYEVHSKLFLDAPTTQVRALATAVDAVSRSIRDADEIPLALARDKVDRALTPYYLQRLRGTDNVDGHVLTTACLASTMQLLEHPQNKITPLLNWIERGSYVSSFAAVQQAALWLPDLHVPLNQEPKNELEKLYKCLLAVKAAPGDSVEFRWLLDALKDPVTPVGRRSIIAEALVCCGDETLVRVAGEARQIQNDLNAALAAKHAPLAVICLLTAFLIRVYAAQEPTAGDVLVEPIAPAHTDERADLTNQLQGERHVVQELSDTLRLTRAFGTKAVAWSVGLAITLIIVLSGIFISNMPKDWAEWGVGVIASGAVGGVLYCGSKARRVECEPRLLRLIRDIRSGGEHG